MQRTELSAWTLLIAAMVLGTVSTVTLAGCNPPESADSDTPAEDVTDTTTDESTDAGSANSGSAGSGAPTTLVSTTAAVAHPGAATPDSAKPEDVVASGGDWPQWGGTYQKNNAPGVKRLPVEWNIGKFDRRTGAWDNARAVNINWFANLGSQTYGNPVVAGGRVYVGTNNGNGYLKRFPAQVDLGCLLAFDEKTGEFQWQHSSEKLSTGRVHDWPLQGICCSPLVEGERLWFVTSRGEVRCLDTEGFYDGEDDGAVVDEVVPVASIADNGPSAEAFAELLKALAAGKLTDSLIQILADAGEPVTGDLTVAAVATGQWTLAGTFNGVDRKMTIKHGDQVITVTKTLGVHDQRDADVVWVYDMMGPEMGISQHNMCSCSVTAYGDFLFVATGNALDEAGNLPAPEAPSFICMNKNTGKVLWTDSSPGRNILHGQWSSPAVGVFDGVPQALFAGGDGILYSFRADGGKDGKPELLWKFDCNPKTTIWIDAGEGTRNNLIATPVVYGNYVYIAVGQDPENGEGQGHLWCIDATKRGDISPTLAVKVDGSGKRVPIEHNRIQAVNEENGELEVENPNAGDVWHYALNDVNDDGEYDFEEKMHRTLGTVAIKDDVLYVADFSGLIHCLDANGTKDGEPIVHFTYDMLAQSWGSPLIAAGHVFFGDEDGDVAIFEFGPKNVEPIDEINMRTSVYSTPVAANDTLFISTKDKLFSIGLKE